MDREWCEVLMMSPQSVTEGNPASSKPTSGALSMHSLSFPICACYITSKSRRQALHKPPYRYRSNPEPHLQDARGMTHHPDSSPESPPYVVQAGKTTHPPQQGPKPASNDTSDCCPDHCPVHGQPASALSCTQTHDLLPSKPPESPQGTLPGPDLEGSTHHVHPVDSMTIIPPENPNHGYRYIWCNKCERGYVDPISPSVPEHLTIPNVWVDSCEKCKNYLELFSGLEFEEIGAGKARMVRNSGKWKGWPVWNSSEPLDFADEKDYGMHWALKFYGIRPNWLEN